jgi:hypothetical protein
MRTFVDSNLATRSPRKPRSSRVPLDTFRRPPRRMTKSQFMQFVQDAVTVDYGEGDVEESFNGLLPPGMYASFALVVSVPLVLLPLACQLQLQ